MIDRQEVLRIARLARLELSEAEIDQYLNDLTSFLISGKKLQEADVEGIQARGPVDALPHHLRQDQVQGSLSQEVVLASGPQTEDGFFKVPRIVGEDK